MKFYNYIFRNHVLSALMILFCILCCQMKHALAADLPGSGMAANDSSALNLDSIMSIASSTPYTIPNNGATVPPGTYSSIVVPNPAAGSTPNRPDFYIGTGTVTLAGGDGMLFDTTYTGIRQAYDGIFIQPNGAGAAVLVLQGGEAEGSLNFIPARYRNVYYPANLLIGSGAPNASANLPTVTLTGHIDGLARSVVAGNFAAGRTVTVETQGANLVVNGAIGYHNGYSFITYLNALRGNIEVKADNNVYASDGRISAFMATAQNGFHIEAATESMVYGVNLAKNTAFRVTEDDRLVVVNTIGDPNVHGGGGKMEAGSLLEAADFLELWGGVQSAGGTMKSRLQSIFTHDPTNSPMTETLEASILQNGSIPLTLDAFYDVMAGGMEVDTVKSGRDIISGSVSANRSVPAKGHIFINAGGDGFHYPRASIVANTVTAVPSSSEYGRVIAGAITLPLTQGKTSSLTAGHLMTIKQGAEGSLPASSGNFTMTNGTFNLTESSPVSYQVGDGSTTGTQLPVTNLNYASYVGNNMDLSNIKGNFTSLGVENTSKVSGGSLQGTLLHTGSANFSNVSSTTLDAFEVVNDLTAAGNGSSAVTTTTVGGVSSITGGSYKGSVFTGQKDASFLSMNTLEMSKSLAAQNINITGSGTANIVEATAGQNLTLSDSGERHIAKASVTNSFIVNGGSYEGTELTAANANISNSSSLNVDGNSVIAGSLAANGNKNLTFANLQTGGAITVEGGAFNAAVINAGTSASPAHVTLNASSFNIASGASASAIHGDLVSTGSRSGKFGTLAVDESVSVNGGFVEGTSLVTKNVSLTNKTHLHVDDLKLDSASGNLDIESGSVLTVNTINAQGTDDLVKNGNLIILGDDHEWSTLGDIDLEQARLDAEPFKVRLETGNITGKGQGASVDDIRVHQLHAKDINITDANLFLTGLGNEYASIIDNNLTIRQNGDSRLSDLNVGGSVDISGGSVIGRQLVTGGDASFANMDLTLAGLGDPETKEGLTSQIGGSLKLSSSASQLGDINIAGALNSSGGSVEADWIKTGADAVFDGSDVHLSGLKAKPSEIGGDLILNNNKSADLWHINVNGSITATDSTVSAHVINVGKDVNLSGSAISLRTLEGQQSRIMGSLTLRNNREARLGTIAVNGDINVSGGSVSASNLQAGANARFNDVDLVLNGDSQNPSRIAGNLTLSSNKSAAIDTLEVGGRTSAQGGSLMANSLITRDLALNGTDSRFRTAEVAGKADIAGGNLAAETFRTNALTMRNGLKAALEDVMLDGSNKMLSVGTESDATGNTLASIRNLSLNGGSLLVGNVHAAPVGLAVLNLRQPDGTNGNANGHIGVGMNGRLVIGSEDNAWLPASLISPRAILALAQPTRLAPGYGIHVTGVDMPATFPGQIKFDPSSLFVIDGSDSKAYYRGQYIKSAQLNANNGAVGSLSAEKGVVRAEVKPGAQIYIRNPKPNTTIVALGENINTVYVAKNPRLRDGDGEAWKDENLQYDDSDKVKIERLDGEYAGQFSVTFLGDAPGKDQANDLPRQSAGRIAASGAVPQLALTANRAAHAAMAERTDLRHFPWHEEDFHARDFALWAVPLYKADTGWGLTAGNYDYDYHGAIGGIAIGSDVTIEETLRLGISFNIGGGYATSGADLLETTNNMNFWGLGAYGAWRFAPNFSLSGNIAYTSVYNKLKQNGSGAYGGNDLKADVQSYAIGAGMQLEYLLPAHWLDIYPHIGVRYHYFHANDYDISQNSNDIINGSGFSQNIWTFPAGVKFASDFSLENGWKIRGQADLRVTPAAGDIEMKSTSRFADSSAEQDFHTQIMDYITYGGSVGLEASKNNFTLGVTYSVDAGMKTFGNTIFGTLRYEF